MQLTPQSPEYLLAPNQNSKLRTYKFFHGL